MTRKQIEIRKAIWPVMREWLPLFITEPIDYFLYRAACRLLRASQPREAATYEAVSFLLWRKVLSPRR